jgi:phage virion morphogenesis protein
MAGSIDVRVDIDDADARRKLAALRATVADPTPAMEDIARALRNHTEDAFQGQRSPFGAPWESLTPAYVDRERSKGGRGGEASPILQRDGGLAASVDSRATRDSAEVGAGNVYAAIHQFGGTAGMRPGPAAIPKRSYLPVSRDGRIPDTLREEVLEIIQDHLGRALA